MNLWLVIRSWPSGTVRLTEVWHASSFGEAMEFAKSLIGGEGDISIHESAPIPEKANEA